MPDRMAARNAMIARVRLTACEWAFAGKGIAHGARQ